MMAVTFYVVFLLSPCIVNFAKNTYWLVMLGMVSFLLVDACVKISPGVFKKEIYRDFQKIFVLGFFALAGFACAFALHAELRGAYLGRNKDNY